MIFFAACLSSSSDIYSLSSTISTIVDDYDDVDLDSNDDNDNDDESDDDDNDMDKKMLLNPNPNHNHNNHHHHQQLPPPHQKCNENQFICTNGECISKEHVWYDFALLLILLFEKIRFDSLFENFLATKILIVRMKVMNDNKKIVNVKHPMNFIVKMVFVF